jgi:hypothetical protein
MTEQQIASCYQRFQQAGYVCAGCPDESRCPMAKNSREWLFNVLLPTMYPDARRGP